MNKVWYKKPAKFWRQALPIGNGHTGVMIFGGKCNEQLALNDGTLWSGYPKDQTNSESLQFLPKVRELIFEGKHKEADALCREKMCGAFCESFLPLGSVYVKIKSKGGKEYRRELDLEDGVHTVTSNQIRRESFASYPDKIVAYHLESTQPFSFTISADSKLKSTVSVSNNGLNLTGNAPDYVAPNYQRLVLHPVEYNKGKGMSFCARAEVESNGTVNCTKKSVSVNDATNATIYLTTATGFCGYDKMPLIDRSVPLNECIQRLKAVEKNYITLKKRHIDDFRKLFSKQSFTLGEDSNLPTDELVKQAKNGDVSKALMELFYGFGKYLMISGSRKGGQAMNLQGIWNQKVRPPWSSNYTTNINAQMNYWCAVRSGLTDCLEPYVRMIHEIMNAGKKTAKVNYGCDGFACNHNVDIWRKTAPVQGPPSYMYAPLCGAWLANELYSHYKNGKLEEYSETVLKIAEEAARFSADYLTQHNDQWVTCPSASPEAEFTKDKARCSLDYASSFEMGIVKQAFNNYLEFAKETELKKNIQEKLAKMLPYQSGATGIREWQGDFPITQKGHRHFSPLYAFYPGTDIGYYSNPRETKLVKQLFDYRLQNSNQFIGWSGAWSICLAARLHQGQTAYKAICGMLGHSVFYNLFDIHPPYLFQIDGNMGYVAGVNEMLIYEEQGVIELLPAIPKEWQDGSVENMIVNGASVSFSWKSGKVTKLKSDQPVRVLNQALATNAVIDNSVTLIELEELQ